MYLCKIESENEQKMICTISIPGLHSTKTPITLSINKQYNSNYKKILKDTLLRELFIGRKFSN